MGPLLAFEHVGELMATWRPSRRPELAEMRAGVTSHGAWSFTSKPWRLNVDSMTQREYHEARVDALARAKDGAPVANGGHVHWRVDFDGWDGVEVSRRWMAPGGRIMDHGPRDVPEHWGSDYAHDTVPQAPYEPYLVPRQFSKREQEARAERSQWARIASDRSLAECACGARFRSVLHMEGGGALRCPACQAKARPGVRSQWDFTHDTVSAATDHSSPYEVEGLSGPGETTRDWSRIANPVAQERREDLAASGLSVRRDTNGQSGDEFC
jgi:hypothetical protein